jgi:hypothetical protein
MCLLVCRRTGLVVFKIAPWSGWISLLARDGSSVPEERQAKERGSPVCSTKGSAPSVRRARSPDRGVRERPYAGAGCHASPRDTGFSAANTVKARCRNTGIGLSACAASEVRAGVATAGAVKLLSTQIVRKQAKAFSSRTTLHIACNAVVNAFQQYEGLAGLATAKLERR